MTLGDLIEKWHKVGNNPSDIADFCSSIPPELHPSFVTWLMQFKEYIEGVMAATHRANSGAFN